MKIRSSIMINDVFGMNKNDNDDVNYDVYEGPYEFVETMPNEE